MRCSKCQRPVVGAEEWCIVHGDQRDLLPGTYAGPVDTAIYPEAKLPMLPREMPEDLLSADEAWEHCIAQMPFAKQVFFLRQVINRLQDGSGIVTEELAREYRIDQRTAQRWVLIIRRVLPLRKVGKTWWLAR